MNTLNGEPDAHTFIHETGHLFGLVDYYPKGIDNDVAKNVLEPTGEIDMMDCSMGDHSALSKMFLDWARPYHVNDSCTIHINSLINKGDLILINDNWNGSVFDEYYLIELYSPFGLNSYDVTNGVVINDKVVTLPVLPGIKIYHVDARLGYFVSKTGTDSKADTAFSHYCNEIHTGTAADFGNYINFAHDNSTYPESTDKQRVLRNYLYELELNKVGHPVSGNATDINLFHKGDTFKVETFNQMNATKYEIKVKSLSFYDATIEITKIESQETVED